MAEPKHTPGPWTLNKTTMGEKLLGWHITAALHGSSLPICLSDKYSEYRDAATEEANARMIAASPIVTDALQIALRALEAISEEMTVGDRYTNAGQYLIDALQPARDAIALVTGAAPQGTPS